MRRVAKERPWVLQRRASPLPADTSGGGLSHRFGTLRHTGTRRERGKNVAVSVLFRIDQNGRIEVVDDGPAPAVTVDDAGQLHAESGIITHAGEDPDGDLWRWLS